MEKLKNGEITKIPLNETMIRKRKETIWHNYSELKYVASGIILNEHVMCNVCQKLFAMPINNSTSNLKRHIRSCEQITYCNDEADAVIAGKRKRATVQAMEKDDWLDLTSAACSFVYNDSHAFRSIGGMGLNDLLTGHRSIKNKYVENDIVGEEANILPSSSTLKRNILLIGDIVRDRLSIEISDIIEKRKGIALSADIWSAYGRNYLGIVLHFVRGESDEISTRLIAHRVFSTSTEAVNVRNVFDNILQRFKLSTEVRQNNVFVITDRGKNMISAFGGEFVKCHHKCSIHMIHNTIENMFPEPKPNKPKLITREIYDKCKALVSFINKSKYRNQMKPMLQVACPTRWATVLTMIRNLILNWSDIRNKLTAAGKVSLMNGLELTQLELLKEFLEPFASTIKELESSAKPTLHLVLPAWYNIERHVQYKTTDNEIIREAKKRAQKYIQNLFLETLDMEINFYLAMYLHPSMKDQKNVLNTKKDAVKNCVCTETFIFVQILIENTY